MFREFGDLEGTYDEVLSAVNDAEFVSPDSLVRQDSFQRRGKEVHRIYFVCKHDYEIFFTEQRVLHNRTDSFIQVVPAHD